MNKENITVFIAIGGKGTRLKNITGEVIPKKEESDVLESSKVIKNNKNLQLDEKKGNNDLEVNEEETKSSEEENLPILIENSEIEAKEESSTSIDTSESINEAIKQDIIDSLPEKDDPGYFDLLLEKIGF